MAKKRTYGGSATLDASAIGGIDSISFPGVETNIIDVSSWDGSGWVEKIGGLKDGGTVEVSGFADEADVGQAKMISAVGTTVAFVMTDAGGLGAKTLSVSVIVGPYSKDRTDRDGAARFTWTGTCTGAVTFA